MSEDAADVPAGPLVALDTSFLMAPVERDLRPFDELDRIAPDATGVVPTSVVAELESLSAGPPAGEETTAASVGLELSTRLSTVTTTAAHADDALVELASEGRVAYVATLDADLRERVLARDVPVICLRGERKLTVTR